jgi:hypothetical protein
VRRRHACGSAFFLLLPETCRACRIASWPHNAGLTASERYYADGHSSSLSTAPDCSRRTFRFANNRHGSLLGTRKSRQRRFAPTIGSPSTSG